MNKKLLGIIAMLMVVALALTACGGSSAPASSAQHPHPHPLHRLLARSRWLWVPAVQRVHTTLTAVCSQTS